MPSKPSIREVLGARNRRYVPHAAFVGVLMFSAVAVYFWPGRGDTGKPAEALPETPQATTTVAATNTPTVAPTAVPTLAPVSETLAAARMLYREGRYGAARSAFLGLAAAATDDEERANALIGAATAAFDLNDQDAGFAALGEAVEAAPAGSAAAATARYLLVKKLNDAGRESEAAKLFGQAPNLASDLPIEDYYKFEGGRSTWESVGRGTWDRLLADPEVSGALKNAIHEENVERWRSTGDGAGLVRALDALIAATGDPAARFERATIAADAGDSATFGAQLNAIVVNSPGSRYAGLALDELDAAGLSVDPGAAGVSYYRRGQYARAIEVLVPAIDAAPTANDLAFRAYYLAASYEDSGQAANAVHYYDIAANSSATTSFPHRGQYWAARVTEGTGAATSASTRYVQLAQSPAGEFTEEAAFRAGYVLYEAGDTGGALSAWAALSSGSSARLEYWRAQALEESGDAAGAKVAFERAVELGPLDLHGIEASRALGREQPFTVAFRERDLSRPVDWAAISSWLSGRIGGGPAGSAPTAACDLMTAGLRFAAIAEIRGADTGDTWRSFELMREARECGLTDLAAQLAVAVRIEAGVASHEPPKDLLRVSYPIDFGATVESEAEKVGIDPLFFASLIRQESFWDPAAHSIADARGLTQVIPPTGQAIADALGVEDFGVSDLFRPALSLEFGAYYLGGQVREYGNPLFALSAYNAGPGNAHRWNDSGARTPAEIVEVIDFVETKNYVTYIFEAYAHYQRAWAD